MSKFSNSISSLFNNPIVFTPLFTQFYSTLNPQPKNILLSYFVLPLVLTHQTKNWLLNCNKTSSFNTFSKIDDKNNPKKTKHDNLFGLPERIHKYKDMTNLCLQYAFDNEWLKLNDDLTITVIKKATNQIDILNVSYKASGKICNIFYELDVVKIYTALGVKRL